MRGAILLVQMYVSPWANLHRNIYDTRSCEIRRKIDRPSYSVARLKNSLQSLVEVKRSAVNPRDILRAIRLFTCHYHVLLTTRLPPRSLTRTLHNSRYLTFPAADNFLFSSFLFPSKNMLVWVCVLK